MLNQVQNFITKEALFKSGDNLVFACSGGKDSMLLLDVLQRLNYKLIVAHCNYNLRGEDSNEDEKLIATYCKEKELPFRSISFDTLRLSKEKKQSIQELARSLRYTWLEELRMAENAQCVVTAHHLQDNMETLFFKIAKGTGVKGIRGILPKQGFVVRPLLHTPLNDILDYLKNNKIVYREDQSNASLAYDRNKIRHQLMEPLLAINPSLSESMSEHFSRWRDIESFHQIIVEEWRAKWFKSDRGSYILPIKKILKYGFNGTLLFELLRTYGFNSSDVQDLLNGLQSPEVKEYLSASHRLLKDREFLLITPLDKLHQSDIFTIAESKRKLDIDDSIHLTFHPKPIGKLSGISKGNNYAYIDAGKLTYPLYIRKWKTGDYFYPMGLQKASGKASKKNVAKFLRDEKTSAFDKENTWVLVSDGRIVWVVGHRLDERFKLEDKTTHVLTICKK